MSGNNSHPLRNYARHVQKALVEAGLPRPPYTWCLVMVQRAWDGAKEGAASREALKDALLARILPTAKLVQQVEGRYRMPTGTG